MNANKTGELIAKLRKEKGMTQIELAEILNVSDRTISKWENGKGFPEITQFPKLSDIFNVRIDELMAGELQNKEFGNIYEIDTEKSEIKDTVESNGILKFRAKIKKNRLVFGIASILIIIITLSILLIINSNNGQGNNNLEKVTITFVNYNNEVLMSYETEKGKDIIYSGTIPLRDSDMMNTYIFSNWNKPLGKASQNETFAAEYISLVRKYNVTYYDVNGRVLEKLSYDAGGLIPEPSILPSKGGNPSFLFWCYKEGIGYSEASYSASHCGNVSLAPVFADDASKGLIFTYDSANNGYVLGLIDPDNVYDSNAIADISEIVVVPSYHTGEEGTYPVIEIGISAFTNITHMLKKIYIPPTVTKISNRAFMGSCISEVIFYGDSKLQFIDLGAFKDCHMLTAFNFPDKIVSIKSEAFMNTAISEVAIGARMTEITSSAFGNCPIVKFAVDSNNEYYTAYDGSLFSKDKQKLIKYAGGKTSSDLIIPSCVTELDHYSLSGAVHLETVTLHPNLLIINQNAFEGCSSIRSLNIPSLVYYIGIYAFHKCSSLVKIEFMEGSDLHLAGFDKCHALKELTLRSNTTLDWATFEDCQSLTTIRFNQESDKYSIVDGVLFNNDMTELIYYPSGLESLNYQIPISVKRIGNKAFFRHQYLKNVVCNEGLEEIGISTFAKSRLQKITLSSSVKVLDSACFQYCITLKTVEIPSGSALNTVDFGCFDGCINLDSPLFPDGVKFYSA